MNLTWADSYSMIFNRQRHLPDMSLGLMSKRSNPQPLVRATVFDGIGDQILKALDEGREIGAYRRQSRLNVTFEDVFRAQHSSGVFQSRLDHLCYIHGAQIIDAARLPRRG